MLAHAATPGWRGAIKDFTRVLGGELSALGSALILTVKQSTWAHWHTERPQLEAPPAPVAAQLALQTPADNRQ